MIDGHFVLKVRSNQDVLGDDFHINIIISSTTPTPERLIGALVWPGVEIVRGTGNHMPSRCRFLDHYTFLVTA